MIERKWRVRLGTVAELDFANILKWTTESFGARQARTYRNTLLQAIGEFANGPDVVGSKARDEIMPRLRTLHVARHGRRGRHVLLYRVGEGRIIEIGRILHDRMDLRRHLPFRNDEGDQLEPGANPAPLARSLLSKLPVPGASGPNAPLDLSLGTITFPQAFDRAPGRPGPAGLSAPPQTRNIP